MQLAVARLSFLRCGRSGAGLFETCWVVLKKRPVHFSPPTVANRNPLDSQNPFGCSTVGLRCAFAQPVSKSQAITHLPHRTLSFNRHRTTIQLTMLERPNTPLNSSLQWLFYGLSSLFEGCRSLRWQGLERLAQGGMLFLLGLSYSFSFSFKILVGVGKKGIVRGSQGTQKSHLRTAERGFRRRLCRVHWGLPDPYTDPLERTFCRR